MEPCYLVGLEIHDHYTYGSSSGSYYIYGVARGDIKLPAGSKKGYFRVKSAILVDSSSPLVTTLYREDMVRDFPGLIVLIQDVAKR